MLRKLGVDPEKRIFSFIGTFVGSIDLTTVIEAARLLHREGREDIQFVLSGSGQDDSLYRSLAGDLSNVVFTGWINQQEISALSMTAWASIAAYKKGALMSLTNKLFEYMSFGLPILSSLPGEAAHIVLGNDCGAFYEPGDPASLANQVRRLADNLELRSRQSRNALRLFEEHYSAQVVYRRMADFLEAATGKQDILPFADGPSTRATGGAESTVLGK